MILPQERLRRRHGVARVHDPRMTRDVIRYDLHVLESLLQAQQEPPWANGQGVGLPIRRLWARVPQGVWWWLHLYSGGAAT